MIADIGRNRRIDIQAILNMYAIETIATVLFGPPLNHSGKRLSWKCPFHDDHHPSLIIDKSKQLYNCYPCQIGGDVVNLVMRAKRLGFLEAVAFLTGGTMPTIAGKAPGRAATRPADDRPAQPSGMPEADATALVEAAADRLGTIEGVKALDYLHARGLTDATIRKARLGYTSPLDLPGRPRGVVVPWFHADRLALVTIRQPRGVEPKYREVFRNPARVVCYPDSSAIQPGRPVILAEGEFDALLLGQELEGIDVAVLTIGPASGPAPCILRTLLPASSWLIAADADWAGDSAAAMWLESPRAHRVRPPAPFKDWTEARQGGVDLLRWWTDRMGGIETPPLFSWEELASWRWGPARHDPAAAADDEAGERSAIQAEGNERTLNGTLVKLNAKGVRVDGNVVFPRVAIGTVTGRITYSSPPLQGMPPADRTARITPITPGRVFIKADYGQIEPRILHAILRKQELIDWETGDDLYRTLASDTLNRDDTKNLVNKIINGGKAPEDATGRLAEFIQAAVVHRDRTATQARNRGSVPTLSGRVIALDAREKNFSGKAVNRVIQGTAADIFNRAVLAIDCAIEDRHLHASIELLIHDELWIECDPDVASEARALMRSAMEAAPLVDGVAVPVRFDQN